MARLFGLNEESGEPEENFTVREIEGHQFVVWSEDLDTITLSISELRLLAKAMDFKLVPKK